MLTIAYVDCGLSVEQFYDLSFYEWGLEILKLKKRSKAELIDWESNAVLFRELMALIANVNRNPKRRALPYEGSDFIRLSFDKPKEEESRLMTPEEVEAKFKNVKFIKEKAA